VKNDHPAGAIAPSRVNLFDGLVAIKVAMIAIIPARMAAIPGPVVVIAPPI